MGKLSCITVNSLLQNLLLHCTFSNLFASIELYRWEKQGAKGWNYQNCLPYFKKAQTHQLGGDEYRGGNGPLNVSRGISGNIFKELEKTGKTRGKEKKL